MEQARQRSKDAAAFKIDISANRFVSDSGQLRAFPKDAMSREWLTKEGVLDPYPAAGSSSEFQGVLVIEDQGAIEYGSQKDDAHEYFLHGRLEGRLLFRRLTDPSGEGDLWVAIKPQDQTPLVLSVGEVENKWLPPPGTSALPESVRKQIPEDLAYWKAGDAAEARKRRDTLAQKIASKEIVLDFSAPAVQASTASGAAA
jgi:hypothetical protein